MKYKEEKLVAHQKRRVIHHETCRTLKRSPGKQLKRYDLSELPQLLKEEYRICKRCEPTIEYLWKRYINDKIARESTIPSTEFLLWAKYKKGKKGKCKNLKKEKTNNFVHVGVIFPKKEVQKIKDLVAEGRYLNVSDFCRTAIRKEIRENED